MSAPRPSHVVWITTDHMRYDCLGANGNPAMHTPNLDRLAAGGINFTGCYGQNPLCMPSRCSFMTGLYPQQTGITDNGRDLPADFRPTVARAFGAAGYRTCQIGKLHFQSHEDNDLDPRPRRDYGFDVFWSAEEPGCYEDAYRTWLRGEHPDLVPVFTVPRPCSVRRAAGEEIRVLDAPWEASFSGWVALQAERYLTTWQGRLGREFVHLGFYAPHPPLNPTREMFAPYAGMEPPPHHWREGEDEDKPEPLRGMLRRGAGGTEEFFREYRRHFYAMVTGVDLAVGRLLGALERIGALEDTLLVFSSDHGDYCGDHRLIAKSAAYYDEVLHLPLVLHWPRGFGDAGRRVDGLLEMVDLLPTLLGCCGIPVPSVMAGRDLSEHLLVGAPVPPREDVYAYHGPGHIMLRTDVAKYIRYAGAEGPDEVLYDLTEDPGEYRNLAGDPAAAAMLGDLRERAFTRCVAAGRSPIPRIYRF